MKTSIPTQRKNLDLRNYTEDISDFQIYSSGMFNNDIQDPISEKPLFFTGVLPKNRRKSNQKSKVPVWKQ